MKVTPELVRSMARLARIDLREEEIGELAPQLDAIVGYFRLLRETDSPAEGEFLPRAAPGRPDEPEPRAAPLSAVAPDLRHGFVAVPRVVSRDGRSDG